MHIFSKFASGWPPAVQCLSFDWQPAGCKFYSVSCQPDANCIRLVVMQYKIPKFINSLHAAGDQLNDICIWLVANQMQIWLPRWDNIFKN
jgi:hypothetical protein